MPAARAVQHLGGQSHDGARALGDAVEGAGVLAVRVRQPGVQLAAVGGVVVGRTLLPPEVQHAGRARLQAHNPKGHMRSRSNCNKVGHG